MSQRTMSDALYECRQMMLDALPIFTKAVTPSEGHRIWQAQFTLSKAVLAVTNHLFVFHGLWHRFQEDVLQCVARHRGELTGLQFPWVFQFLIGQENT